MRVLLLISMLALGACAGGKQATLPTAWARVDGQPVNSALMDIDSLDCKDGMPAPDGAAGEKAANRAMVDDFVSCMRGRGYVQSKS